LIDDNNKVPLVKASLAEGSIKADIEAYKKNPKSKNNEQ
jgi:hypothetical protein